MAGDCVPVIKMTVLLSVEFYPAVVIKTCGNEPIRCNGLYDGQVAVGDAERLVRRGELDAVAGRERLHHLPVHTHAGEAAWIVNG